MEKLPQPTMQLFIRNTDIQNHNTRLKESLHVQMGEQKGLISMLAFMACTFGIYFPNMSK